MRFTHWILAIALLVFGQSMTAGYAAEPVKSNTASAAKIAACQNVRKEVGEGQAAQTNTSGSIGAGAAVGGILGAVVGAAIAGSMNEADAEKAYRECLAGRSTKSASTGSAGAPVSHASAASGAASRPTGKGIGACSNGPKSCSEARRMCNNVCATKNFGGSCSNICIQRFDTCRTTGVWTTERCNLTGLAQH